MTHVPACPEGSSPQMRGALEVTVFAVTQQRIIPADAGSTVPQIPIKQDSKDHPRRCGEHGLRVIAVAFRQGSSPQMRGAPRISA